MNKTYYIRSLATGEIVNALMTQKRKEDIILPEGYDKYFLDENPPLHFLKRYEYWENRP